VAYNQYICGYFRKKYLTTYRMQGKGLIKLFLVLLILVTVMQFLYMLPTQRVEADAEAYAMSYSESEQKIAKSRYLDSMSSEVIFSIPLLKKYTYSDLKKSQLALGLDLKGGYSAVMQVNVRKLLFELSFFRVHAGGVAHLVIDSASDLIDIKGYKGTFEKANYGYQAGIGIDAWKIRIDINYEGNLSKFGNHITIDDTPYSFKNSAARLILNAGFRF